MEDPLNTSIPEPELALMYQNITEVVNLKCFQCHVKLKEFLKSLLKTQLKQCCKKPKNNVKPPPDPTPCHILIPDPAPISTKESDSKSNSDFSKNEPCSSSGSAKPTLEDFKEFVAQNTSSETDLNKKTLYIFKKVKSDFIEFAQKESKMEFQDLLKDKTKLEDITMHFFYSMRTNNGKIPKKNSFEMKKSFVKKVILQESSKQLDISNQTEFPRFMKFYKSYIKKVETETPSSWVSAIPEDHMRQIYGFLTYLHTILNGTCQDLSYIPQGYESRFHHLVLRGAIFILLNHSSKGHKKGRYRTEINMLKVKNFQVIIDPTFGKVFKNIQTGEYIPFRENKYGLNCGQYLEDYTHKLSPGCPWFLCHPAKETKSFLSTGLLNLSVWFESTKIGKNFQLIQDMCQALGLPKYTNGQVPFLKLPALSGYECEEYYNEEDSMDQIPDPLDDHDQPDGKRIKLEYHEEEEDQFEEEEDFEVEHDHKPQFVYVRDDSIQ